MTVSAVGAGNTFAQQEPAFKNTMGKDEFMKLLITELRYQDAMNPMSDREFISQMAQFSSLEQMQNMNTLMTIGIDQVLNYLSWNTLNQGVELLGKNISYMSGEEVKTGTVEALKQINGTYHVQVKEDYIPLTEILEVK